jgi:catechol 2,3-dioxygenase-like lactoylglutathione lyase family enzyme
MVMAEGLGTNIVVQVGIIVKDIEKTLDGYVDVFQLEKRPAVQITDGPEKSNMKYRGNTSNAVAKLAFINMGQLDIELIEPVGGPSTWKEFLDEHGEGVHHLAFFIKGTDQVVAYLEGKGIPQVQRGDYTGGMYSYMDSAPKLAVMLELLENF